MDDEIGKFTPRHPGHYWWRGPDKRTVGIVRTHKDEGGDAVAVFVGSEATFSVEILAKHGTFFPVDIRPPEAWGRSRPVELAELL